MPAATIDPVKLLKKYMVLLAGSVGVGLVLGVAANFVFLNFFPQYTAEVTFHCSQANADVATVDQNIDEDEMERFMQTQVATILSETVFERVANHPRLQAEASTWAAAHNTGGVIDTVEAIQSLQDGVNARIIPGTNLIRLSVQYGKKEDVTALARLVKESYMRLLVDESSSQNNQRLDQLRQIIADIDKDLEDLRQRRDRLVKDEKVDSIDQARTEAAQGLALITAELLEIQQQLSGGRVSLDNYDEMIKSPAGIVYTDSQRAAVSQNPLMINFEQELQRLYADQLALKKTGIKPEHRTYKQLDGQISGLEQKMSDKREELLREYFDSEVDGLRRGIQQMEAQEADLLTNAGELRSRLNDLTRIIGQITDIDTEITALIEYKTQQEEDLGNLSALATLSSAARVIVAQHERLPDRVSFPPGYAIMGIVGMLLISSLTAGAVVLREILDQRVKSPADVALIPRTRVVGMIPMAAEDPSNPKAVETAFIDAPRSVLAESYRQIRAPLLKQMQRAGHRSLLVMSCMPGSGATSVVSNLAFACAAAEQRVLVIDANFRRPSLHKVFDCGEAPGLSDVLAGEATNSECIRETTNERINILPAGSRDNRVFERLGNESMARLLSEMAIDYDLILIDTAPAIVAGDGLTLANRCDASMLVVRAMGEKRGMVARIKNELSDSRAEMLGVLVNAVRAAAGGYMRRNIKATHDYQQELIEEPAE